MKIAKGEDVLMDDTDFIETNEFPVVFKWHNGGGSKTVHVTGSWDGWKRKIPLVKSTHDFSTIINLNPGSLFLLITLFIYIPFQVDTNTNTSSTVNGWLMTHFRKQTTLWDPKTM